MSIDNFIPTVWSGAVLRDLEKSLVFGQLANRDYEGEISAAGDRVKINSISAITVSDYTKNSTSITPEEVEDGSLFLDIDQSKYFAFKIDDVDARQARGDVMDAAMQDAAYRLADTADSYIAGLYTGAGVTSGLGTEASPLSIAPSGGDKTVKGLLALIGRRLTEANCPSMGRWVVLPPFMEEDLIGEMTPATAVTSVQNELEINGRVGRLLGFDVYISNNVSNDGTNYRVLAGTRSAITFGQQISSVEAYRPESSFSDAVKGLHLYGAKVVRADCLASAVVSEG